MVYKTPPEEPKFVRKVTSFFFLDSSRTSLFPVTPVNHGMAPSSLKLKLPKLGDDETFSTFSDWKATLLHELRRDDDSKRFVMATWEKRTTEADTRGCIDKVIGGQNVTAVESVGKLNSMLELIARFVPHYLAHDIVYESTSLTSVWSFIRQFYGFQTSESTFIDFYAIAWEAQERPERLYRRLRAHIADNLLKADGSIAHDGQVPKVDENLSPTTERLIVLRWLELLHPGLPNLIKRHYASQLQKQSLKELQPAICTSLEPLLDELKESDVKANRSGNWGGPQKSFNNRSTTFMNKRSFTPPPSRQPPGIGGNQPSPRGMCRVCFAEGRNYFHSLGDCKFVSNIDKKSFIKSLKVELVDGETLDYDFPDTDADACNDVTTVDTPGCTD